MYNFGKNPPRALESFGVAGLLGESCKVYYDSIFTARHIGRVSDLLNARLKNAGFDELRFRIVLMFNLHEAYRCQLAALAKPKSEALPEPLVIECGVDEEKIVIGISFTYSKDELPDLNLAQKISAGGAKSRLERLIAQISADSDQAVVRIDPSIRQIEVLSLLGLAGKMDASFLGSARPLEVVIVKSEGQVNSLNADYVELGDLNYQELLKTDRPGIQHENSGTGELLVKALLESEKTVKISSVTEHLSETDVRVTADAMLEPEPQIEIDPAAAELQDRLKRMTIGHDSETAEEASPASEMATDESQSEPSNRHKPLFRKLIRKIWPFNRRDEDGEKERVVEAMEPPQEVTTSVVDDKSESGSDHLWKNQVERLESKISALQKEAQHIKKETGNARAQRWADSMMSELLAEKSRIAEMGRKLNLSLRQKEIEFRNKESILNDSLRRKDDQLRHRTYALERAKEQISQLSMAAERTRSQHILGQGGAKTKTSGDTDHSELRKRYELLLKQNEEFRKANQQLMEEKLSVKPKTEIRGNEETQRKLAAAMQLAVKQQKESNQLRSELQKANETILLLKKDDTAA